MYVATSPSAFRQKIQLHMSSQLACSAVTTCATIPITTTGSPQSKHHTVQSHQSFARAKRLYVMKQLCPGVQARTHGITLFCSAWCVASDGDVPGRRSYCAWLQLTHRDTPRRCFWKRALLQTSSVRPINQISCHDPCEKPCEKGAAGRGR
jgi:hypothetical protein